MPPRRPPPLLPRARLLEAITAAPPDARTRPNELYDSRILIAEHEGATISSLPEPWHVAPNTEDHALQVKSAVPAVSGCTYYSQSVPARASDLTGSSVRPTFILTGASDAAASSFITGDGGTDNHNDTPGILEPVLLGRTQKITDIEAMHSISGGSHSKPADYRLLVLELAQGDTPVADANTLARLPELLQNKSLTMAGNGGFLRKIVLGNMGYPDVHSIHDGKRGFLEAFEKTLFSGYLSLLPAATVAAAFREMTGASASGGEAYKACKKAVSAFFAPVLEAFGEDRIIWGSDWPRFTPVITEDSAMRSNEAWKFALRLALDVVCDIGLRGASLDKIFHTNAQTLGSRA
ncbi:hypothetical protein P389DRAFT_194423 [Cystobasidium minutum MCA 4210]|uniref:uncharacterized protein n=1 Tax=Cystobasidium minutum MCA 4210 TaxID=1397322 RepID=UPI0034CE581E|eukprot:jgi/Rhomi1/194423/gm1.2637_g